MRACTFYSGKYYKYNSTCNVTIVLQGNGHGQGVRRVKTGCYWRKCSAAIHLWREWDIDRDRSMSYFTRLPHLPWMPRSVIRMHCKLPHQSNKQLHVTSAHNRSFHPAVPRRLWQPSRDPLRSKSTYTPALRTEPSVSSSCHSRLSSHIVDRHWFQLGGLDLDEQFGLSGAWDSLRSRHFCRRGAQLWTTDGYKGVRESRKRHTFVWGFWDDSEVELNACS